MKKLLFTILILLVAASAYAADVNVSVSVGQPGFYGRIDIGDAPRPEFIYEKPIVIRHAPVRVAEQPLYLHVPPGHEKHWSKHCAKYSACGRPVYFVRDSWYNNVYVPHHRGRSGQPDNNRGEKHGKDKRHGNDKKDRHGHDRD